MSKPYLKLGDVLIARNGTTVEVKNTDAEGRLVMMDALTLAVEEGVDGIVDIANLGGPHAGATTAALFLAEFVGDTPWVHVDIAGTMQAEADDSWRSAGATGFGARLLAGVARDFTAS